MKLCPRCREVKPLSEFSKNPSRKDGVGSFCKPCRRVYDHERYARLHKWDFEYVPGVVERGRAKWLRSLKEGKSCADCGKVFPYQVMQWDHRPGEDKRGDISSAHWSWTRAEVLAEIAKCDLVCVNCHTIRTFERSGWATRWLKEDLWTYAVAA